MKRTITIALLTVALLVGFTTPAAASFGGDLATNLSPAQCGGTLVISAFEGVRNDADSGFASYWAFDNYVRNINVWRGADGTYCAIVGYAGTFTSVAGPSPMGTGTVAAGVRGVMYGGYRTTRFTATPLATPLWPTRGYVGTVDYQCDLSGNCPGRIDWASQYFAGADFGLAWWGWEYRAGTHGTWINAIGGSSGDIN
jgi:hypothetical protein